MRELKFRVFDEASGHVCPVTAINFACKTIQIVVPDPDTCGMYETVGLDSATLMQFTGLHDKNGVEIYEGDIMRKQRGSRYFVVEASKNMFVLSGHGALLSDSIYFEDRVVVGNIYEHPGLLDFDK